MANDLDDGLARLSPTLAAAFLGCTASAAWSLEARRGLRGAAAPVDDPQSALIVRKGHEHEARCLTSLRERCGDVVAIPSGTLNARFGATVEAMERGAPLIYQAALTAGSWLGYADFLVRVNEGCPRWVWSYEPWDAKLSHSARPEHLLQIALYGDMLGTVQGRSACQGHLMLGTSEAEAPYKIESFLLDEVRYYVRRAARRLEVFSANLPSSLTPEPCGYCGKCDWLSACEARWEETDHLCRVADITKNQMRRLVEAGVSTLSMLAKLNGMRISGIAPETLARLMQQARLQKQSSATGSGAHEVIAHQPGFGFDRLPTPDAGDLFFDFEGDPMHPGGLEYLCGVLWQPTLGEEDGDAVPGYPHLRFRAFWAHDRAQEKQAFSELMAFLMMRLARAPGAHLYHYAPYEKTALRRLASMHATAETAVDELLRTNRMVDLYRVVRESVRVGEPSYSIKNLERFYMPARTTAVVSGGDSLVIYDRFRETGESSLLNDLRDYNRDDCVSTLLLRNWLIDRAKESGRWPPAVSTEQTPTEDSEATAGRQADREAMEREQASLEAALVSNPQRPDAQVRLLMADLVGFHRREAKPAWWAYFDRQERSAVELQDDEECLGGCVADGDDWIGSEKRSLIFRYRYPEQETKLREDVPVHLAVTGEAAGTIAAIDEAARTVVVKRGAVKGKLPQEISLIPGGPVSTDTLRDAVWSVARDMMAGGVTFPHIISLLRREPPRLTDRLLGAPIIQVDDRDDPGRLLEGARRAVHALDRSWLVIQGPPGAGKTYTTSQLIASLIRSGKTVGVASNSHKAIDNVLHAIEERLTESRERVRVLGQKKDSVGERYEGRGFFESVTNNDDVDPSIPVIGGTAWAFARPELLASRDVLFVDEAGQVSLGNLIAMATAAKSIVLVGDQMQLAQPIQGAHPGESGCSALEYLLEGHAVVPAERGIFLSKTWRMHPDLCSFISAAVYEGKLHSEAGCGTQRLVLAKSAHPSLKPAGLAFLPVQHMGCRQKSEQEAFAVRDLVSSALNQRVVGRTGVERAMTLEDVLVVAPYNMQVNLLRSILPQGARVGTVDKFQGQEAEVVIVSMATSGADDMPRDASFLLSRNRLNVAISRARCLSVLVASPGLLDFVAYSVEEMRLANVLCWAAEFSGGAALTCAAGNISNNT
ncbi:MAG TPA: TM0106 family RecB-like putative nuclease [Fimbriimonas sp.]|nr:TM0106 family RecB-like putative nuclease [Fimbriimonas sp.]